MASPGGCLGALIIKLVIGAGGEVGLRPLVGGVQSGFTSFWGRGVVYGDRVRLVLGEEG